MKPFAVFIVRFSLSWFKSQTLQAGELISYGWIWRDEYSEVFVRWSCFLLISELCYHVAVIENKLKMAACWLSFIQKTKEDERFSNSMITKFVYVSVNTIVYAYQIILHRRTNESSMLQSINSVHKHRITVTLTLVRFDDSIEVIVKNTISRDVLPCSPVDVHRRFGGMYCLHHKNRRLHQGSRKQETISK
jgi:hypothetical protein